MIVVLCETFEEAQLSYHVYLDYLSEVMPWVIKRIFGKCFCVETDDNLRYIFIHKGFSSVFEKLNPDFIDRDDFF